MNKVIDNKGRVVPIKLWLGNIEPGALEQASNLSKLPFAYKHIAIMPDAHQGYGMPIGGVLATHKTVIPNAVGVDIGCGMCAVKTSLTDISQEQIKRLFGGSKDYKGGIRSKVPVGVGAKHSKKQDYELMPFVSQVQKLAIENGYIDIPCEEAYPIISQEFQNARKQLGTLGSGNHFIEIQKGSDGYIWIMIHSGSRNLGYKVANHYNKIAKDLNEKWFAGIPKKWDLAFLPLDSKEGQGYLREMNYCVEFALANRELMMFNIGDIFRNQFGVDSLPTKVLINDRINIAHNYAQMENHFGQNVMVHRKGATSAREGQIGIIPGDQGSKSYIVKGKGNPESFMSCSHGAGRVMSRTKARDNLNLIEEINKLDKQGIVHSIRNKKDLDEASSAYKDIDVVMENQKDLVDIVVELTPLGVIKG